MHSSNQCLSIGLWQIKKLVAEKMKNENEVIER
jgi:hypothetical protein